MAPPVPPAVVSKTLYVFICLLFLSTTLILLATELYASLKRGAIGPLRSSIHPVACEPLTQYDGEMVHIDCPIRRMTKFRAPAEFSANVDPIKGVFYEMTVEMYQHSIVPGAIRSSLSGIWSSSLVKSKSHWPWSNMENPEFFPHVEGTGRHFAKSLYGGGFKIDRNHIISFHGKTKVKLREDGTYIPSNERPPTRITSATTQIHDNQLWTGDPLYPKVGDLRITFYVSSATHLSAIGLQSGSSLLGGGVWGTDITRQLNPIPDPFSRHNATTLILAEGDFTVDELLDDFMDHNEIPEKQLRFTRLTATAVATVFLHFSLKVFDPYKERTFTGLYLGSGLGGTGIVLLSMGAARFLGSIVESGILVALGLIMLGIGRRLWSKSLPPQSFERPAYTPLVQSSSLPGKYSTRDDSASYAAI